MTSYDLETSVLGRRLKKGVLENILETTKKQLVKCI